MSDDNSIVGFRSKRLTLTIGSLLVILSFILGAAIDVTTKYQESLAFRRQTAKICEIHSKEINRLKKETQRQEVLYTRIQADLEYIKTILTELRERYVWPRSNSNSLLHRGGTPSRELTSHSRSNETAVSLGSANPARASSP